MKTNVFDWKKVVVISMLLLVLLAACSSPEPTAVPEPEQPAEAPEVQEEPTAVPDASTRGTQPPGNNRRSASPFTSGVKWRTRFGCLSVMAMR